MTGRSSIVHKRPSQSPQRDSCTNSNYYNFHVNHTDLNLDVSFDKKSLSGCVSYTLTRKVDCDSLVLDTSYLSINGVKVNDETVDYTLQNRQEPYGSPLIIPLHHTDDIIVTIDYSTTDKCTALQFIQGDTGPFLFSQCQPIHARSMFPCFDTPGVKSSFDMTVRSPLPVLMSGRPVENNANSNSTGEYKFHQPIPIPSYLVAISSGNLVSEPIGPRSLVYSEPPYIGDCKWEFENDMEDFIKVAEKMIFDYEWLNYDVLILPSNFPYGGMENPNITFATPTIVCKDRSQVKVMAHELAHSWAGNLVTNCSWSHFWLNEGWTVYIERRILGAVAELNAKRSGKSDPAGYGEQYRHFSAARDWDALVDNVKSMDPSHSCLVWDLSGNKDPDDFYSRVPYDKGFTFLFYLEQELGGIEQFDPFIKHYFKKFRYQSLDSFQFVDELYEFYTPKGKLEVLDSIDFDQWLFGTGLPYTPKFDTSLIDQCTTLATKWINALKAKDLSQFSPDDIKSMDPNQHLEFIESLTKQLQDIDVDVDVALIRKFVDIYPGFLTTHNAEIKFTVNKLLIKYGNYTSKDDAVINFTNWLGSVGRMKYVRPGYKLLLQYFDKQFAIDTFKHYEQFYHPICKTMVKRDLGC